MPGTVTFIITWFPLSNLYIKVSFEKHVALEKSDNPHENVRIVYQLNLDY